MHVVSCEFGPIEILSQVNVHAVFVDTFVATMACAHGHSDDFPFLGVLLKKEHDISHFKE